MSTNIILTSVDLTGTDAADRALMNLLHDHGDPTLIAGDTLRSAWAQILIVGEQGLDIINTMLELVLLRINLHGSTQAANALALS